MSEQSKALKLECPLCKSAEFKKEEGRIDGKWGMTNHMVNIHICMSCGYMLLFSAGRSFWDVD